ncbi:hypothetical protein FisN_4Lu514 [Fistulifera solaris]|uniref:Uncharacterized protein n=1 Tax=Fistulifera solaris TaxID=1519565 RepID=A0A1Z5JZ24_FISSO|nr:hypothetical protein FisN_4Lu514 [Fistulifera solaris]|eukprot:GAX19264.1 hypothetical protein FisN_4Lu514 [Fistulifera solaris]
MQREPLEDAESEVGLWVVRFVYQYIHYHQHRYAFTVDAHLIVPSQEAGIRPFGLEYANETFLVVRFHEYGI